METAKKKQPRRDRLSALQDCILGHILSFLPTQEAGRAALLSRRWRRSFADVHTISFDLRSDDAYDDERVTAALLSRRRSVGVDAALRSLRLATHYYLPASSDYDVVDQWLSYAVRRGLHELFLETADEEYCRRGCRRNNDDGTSSDSDIGSSSCDSDAEDDDYDYHVRRYVVPAKLYSCATMRALHLAACSLSTLRSSTTNIDLPSLETLSLSWIRHSRSADNIHRLINGCQRLANLTLEACSWITDLKIPPNMRLRRLALRCCHDLRRVTVDLSETRSLEYRGVPPDASFFTLDGAMGALVSAKIDVCWQSSSPREIEFRKLREFLLLFVDTTSLQLQLGWPDTTSILNGSDDFFADFPLFQNLTRLELGSRLADRRVVEGVPGILRRTPNLTALSLKLYGHKKSRKTTNRAGHRNFEVDATVPCLQERVREMSVQQYEGAAGQRMLLKSLLHGALVLESLRVVFANGRHSVLDELMAEIRTWSRNPATRITFS